MNTTVSVVTVCFESETEIEKTLKSVLKQDYNSIEYVIKDGGSEDKTNEIIEKYKPKFQSRGIFFKHISSKDQGIYDAMNTAVENCQGEWVIFMNAGDLFYNNTVLSDIFEHKDWNGTDAVYGHTLFQLSENRGVIANYNANFLDERWSLCHQSLFVRTELLQKFPFDCQYKIVADYDQILRLKKEGYVFKSVNVIIAIMNREGVSICCIGLRNKEVGQLTDKYNLKCKKKSIFLSYIKQFVRGIVPELEIIFFLKGYMRDIIRYEVYRGRGENG